MIEEEREQITNNLDYHPFTPNTIKDKHTFCRVLEDIRKTGYAVDEQDFETDVYAFGAPIFNHEGKLVAGISISTPTAPYSLERRNELINCVVSAGQRLLESLGYINKTKRE